MRMMITLAAALLLFLQSADAQKTSARSKIVSFAPTKPASVATEPDVDINIPHTATRNPDAIAVVIGNKEYKHTKAVSFAQRDAETMKKYLVGAMGFKEGNIFLLLDATKSDFELFFGNKENHRGRLFNSVKPKASDVFVYYSGHGAPGIQDKKGYFVPVECNPNYVELQGYPLDVFYANLAKIPAKSVAVVLDACFSGADVFENVSPIVITLDAPAFTLQNGVALASTTSDQVSSWYNEKQHSMFTYFFFKAMGDREGADVNKDGALTFDEVYRYVSDNSEGVPYYARRINGVEQVPTIQGVGRAAVVLMY
jgi:hypothetical protein